jgi:hypothetical protein
MRDFDPTASSRKSLEDMFFHKEDKKLLEKLKQMEKMKLSKEALREVSGIHNEKVLEKLVELDVKPETVASLSLVPLIEVAWADGRIDEKEKQAVLAAAGDSGVKPGSIEYQLIEQWMVRRPPDGMLEAWSHYIEGLCERLSPQERDLLKADLMKQVTSVARASGGFLGVAKISKKEATMIGKIEAAFDKR